MYHNTIKLSKSLPYRLRAAIFSYINYWKMLLVNDSRMCGIQQNYLFVYLFIYISYVNNI